MAVSILDILRVDVMWRYSTAGDIVNSFDLQVSGAGGAGSNAAVLDAVSLWAKDVYQGTGVRGSMTNFVVHRQIKVFNRTDNTPVGYIGHDADLDGTNAGGAPMPASACLMVLLRTDIPNTVGRKYLPPFSASELGSGVWDASAVAVSTVFGNHLLAPFEIDDVPAFRYVVTNSDLSMVAIPTSAVAGDTICWLTTRKLGIGS